MRRPLAAFGFAFLLSGLAATRLPAVFLLPAGGLCLLFCLAVAFLFKRGAKAYLPLVLLAMGLSLVWRVGYDRLFVRPVAGLAGQEATVTARVEEVQPDYGGDTVRATLTVLKLQGESPQGGPFKLQVNSLPEVQVGDVVETDLRFYAFSNAATAAYNRGRGVYVGASAKTAPQKMGEDLNFLCRMRNLQYAAGDNIRGRLPLRLSSVAAAMSVGDKRTLSQDTVEAYRAAGLSHMLVVSGLHLSVLSAAVFTFSKALLRKKRLAAVACLGVIFLFMAFTGFTPSILRSGIACLMLYVAMLAYQRADVYTSLGLAALLLCLQNPYAAGDAGLQLSFAATFGAVLGGEQAAGLLRKEADKKYTRPVRTLCALGRNMLSPVFVTLATLPVLALNSFGLSLLTVPMNLIAVPLLPAIVLCGFVMALPSGVFLFDFFARVAALVSGVLLVALEKLTNFAASFPSLYVAVGGAFALVAILLCYGLVALAWKTPHRKVFAVAAALTLPAALALHVWLDAGTVHMTLVGSGNNASLVVRQGREAFVLYRSRLAALSVDRCFGEQNVRDCILFVDMRKSAQSTEYISLFHPGEVLVMGDEVVARAQASPLADVELYLQRQGEGNIACVDVQGYKVGIVVGGAELSSYAALDVLVPGGGSVEGEYGVLFVSGSAPDWAETAENVLTGGGSAEIVIRPGRSVQFREVEYGQFT